MDESLPPPMAPPPRPKPKPGQASGANSASNNVFAEQDTAQEPQSATNDAGTTEAEDGSELEEYLAAKIEEEEMGEACEWHLPGMMEGTYIDPYSVPAKYLIEQEFVKMQAVAEEFAQLLEENKKRLDEQKKQKPQS